MLTLNNQFEAETRKIIGVRIQEVKENLSGGCAPDHAAYMRLVGRIEGLNAALECCDEANSIISKR